jgi:hypothetical protein
MLHLGVMSDVKLIFGRYCEFYLPKWEWDGRASMRVFKQAHAFYKLVIVPKHYAVPMKAVNKRGILQVVVTLHPR